jgi:signal transduction histidine kinase
VLGGEDTSGIPAYFGGLGPGLHEVYQDREYHILIKDLDDVRLFLAYDAEHFQRHDDAVLWSLIASVLASLLASFMVGRWIAGRMLVSLRRLTQQVGSGPPTGWTDEYADDNDLGPLAVAFEGYRRRVNAFVEREKEHTAQISHELRTPLAVVNGTVELLLADPQLSPKLRERILRMGEAGKHMAEVVSGLLLLAREPTAADRPAPLCSVEQALRAAVESHRYLLQGKTVEVNLRVNATPQLAAEPALLTIVLGNLIHNAYSYTTSGAVNVQLDADSISIEDTGLGITSAGLPHVFEPHFRGGNTGSVPGGAGMGLHLVKRICDRYNWRIHLRSSRGKGTQVCLVFADEKPA